MFEKMSNKRPAGLGMTNGQFRPCPNTPNCVSTQVAKTDKLHYMEPLTFTGSARDAIAKAAQIISQQKRARIVQQTADYLHAEFRIAFFGFIDDVEIFADEHAHLLHFRSASRVGRSDLGVNRRRMRRLSNLFR